MGRACEIQEEDVCDKQTGHCGREKNQGAGAGQYCSIFLCELSRSNFSAVGEDHENKSRGNDNASRERTAGQGASRGHHVKAIKKYEALQPASDCFDDDGHTLF